MIITKILMTSIDLLDPNDIFQADLDALILRKLNERYSKKCYQSILILNVERILKRSTAKITDNRLDAGASVDVQFEVKGVVLASGEILHGCVVSEIRDDIITAEHEYAGIKLKADPSGQMIKILQLGQKIPVVVHNVRYTINEHHISVLGAPYAPSPDNVIIYNNIDNAEGLSAEETSKLEYMMQIIEKEEEQHKSHADQKQYQFFKDILYSYKTKQKPELNKALASFKPVKLELKELLELKSGCIVYPNTDERINKRLFISNTIMQPDNVNIVINNSLYNILMDVLTKYLYYMQALRGFMEVYPTTDDAKKVMSYWTLCRKLQG